MISLKTHNIDATLALVSTNVKSASSNARLRVFTLGIGSSASSAMCEGIARTGNGVCLMATATEDILGKCAKLVNAAKSSIIRNITCQWGEQANSTANEVQQVPRTIEALYSGLRFIAFALIHGPYTPPQEILIRGQHDGDGEKVELRIPIAEVIADAAQPPLIHTLAAKRLITELEDDRDQAINSTLKEARIVKLGTKYQLASRYTSFIAIDNDTEILPPPTDPPRNSSSEPSFSPRGRVMRARVLVVPDADPPMMAPMGANFSMTPPGTVPKLSIALPNTSAGDPISDVERRRTRSGSAGATSGGLFKCTVGPPAMAAPASPAEIPFDLIKLQSFDGSFAMDDAFVGIVGKSAADKYQDLDLSKSIWATILAIAYLQIRLINQPELLNGLVEKATDFVLESGLPPGTDLKELIFLGMMALSSVA